MLKKVIIVLCIVSHIMQAELFNPFIEQALELAAQWHEQTYRRDRWRTPPFLLPTKEVIKVPVIVHLVSVSSILQCAGWDDITVASGILHDILEDQNRFGQTFSYKQLEDAIGPEVAQIVAHVTEQKTDEQGNRLPWKVRKQDYFNKIRSGTDHSMAISLADKIHNLWSMNQAVQEGIATFKRATPEEQIWYYSTVLDISKQFTDSRLEPMRKELERQLERFKKLLKEKGL